MSNISILGFNNEYLDPTLNNYHLGNGYRAYNPTTMQFTTPDDMSPFGRGGINPYMYCSGDPINNTDPTGHFHLSLMDKIGIGSLIVGSVLSAVFTGGVSLAVVGSVAIGTTSIGTGIASENTTGLTSDLLNGFSQVTGVLDPENEEASVEREVTTYGRIEGAAEKSELGMDRPGPSNPNRNFANQIHDFNQEPPMDPIQHEAPTHILHLSTQDRIAIIKARIHQAYYNARVTPRKELRWWHDGQGTEYWVPDTDDRKIIDPTPPQSNVVHRLTAHGWKSLGTLVKWTNENGWNWKKNYRNQYINSGAFGAQPGSLTVFSRPFIPRY